ncbi:hypothetical protein HGG70_05130 [Rhodobacteraceae bacterium R_SAG4]|nr:hypothetical protein [Rhodobacteraceae bacterium R_SAG4]
MALTGSDVRFVVMDEWCEGTFNDLHESVFLKEFEQSVVKATDVSRYMHDAFRYSGKTDLNSLRLELEYQWNEAPTSKEVHHAFKQFGKTWAQAALVKAEEERRLKEQQAERAELAALPNFGMF